MQLNSVTTVNQLQGLIGKQLIMWLTRQLFNLLF